jgi:dihydropyrimidinase/allantoinase
LKARWTLERGSVVSSAGYSIYEGFDFRDRVVHTLVRGRAVLRDGQLDPSSVGTGRYRRRNLASACRKATAMSHRCEQMGVAARRQSST